MRRMVSLCVSIGSFGLVNACFLEFVRPKIGASMPNAALAFTTDALHPSIRSRLPVFLRLSFRASCSPGTMLAGRLLVGCLHLLAPTVSSFDRTRRSLKVMSSLIACWRGNHIIRRRVLQRRSNEPRMPREIHWVAR